MDNAPSVCSLGSPTTVPILDGEFQPDSGKELLSSRHATLGRPQHLLELACRVTQASWGGIGLVTGDGELVEAMFASVSEDSAAELRRSSWVAELLRYVLRQPASTCLNDLSQEHPDLGKPAGRELVGPFLGMPLNLPGRTRGAIYLCRPKGSGPFSADDEAAVHPICTWLEQGRLLEETHFQSQLQLLNRVAQSAASSLDLKRILTNTLRELDRHLPLQICAVWLVEGEEGVEEPGAGAEVFLTLADVSAVSQEKARALGLAAGTQVSLDQSPFRSCIREGQPLYADWNNLNDPSGEAVCFAVPLRSGGRIVGILQSLSTRSSGFVRDQIQLLYLVADLLGPAISNCQLFNRLQKAFKKLRETQSQLIQTEKMRALGELAGGMAHEFNNSLCGVLGFLELLLLNKHFDASARGYLESARVCALDATETVRRVQDFARREQKGLVLQVLDLNELVRQTMDMVRHKWTDLNHARGTCIHVQIQTEAKGRVAGSPTELREVVTNLVFNAVDAMPAGGTLTVRTWSVSSEVFLSVQDTGVGIPAFVLHRLFEPFFTTKGERGNGLGLSVVFGILQRHQGEIAVESEVGKGSTFTVRLPLASGSAGTAPSAPAPQPETTSSGLRILVIEDDEFVRDFLGKGLTMLGHRPHLTTNGSEGLTAFGAERFDVVLTDLGMPGISGEEVAIQVSQRSPKTPVIVLTGWADQLRAEKETLQGVTGVLGKPITLDALASTLATLGTAGSD